MAAAHRRAACSQMAERKVERTSLGKPVTPSVCCSQKGEQGGSRCLQHTSQAPLGSGKAGTCSQHRLGVLGTSPRLDRLSELPGFFLFCSCKAQLKCQEQEFYSIFFRISQSSLFQTAHHSPFLAHVSHTPVENPREVSPALANTKYTSRKLFTLKFI